jgi:hypothetical protein
MPRLAEGAQALWRQAPTLHRHHGKTIQTDAGQVMVISWVSGEATSQPLPSRAYCSIVTLARAPWELRCKRITHE